MIVHCLRYHEKRKTISLFLLIKKQYALHISQKPCGHISLTMFDFVSRFWCNTVQILIFRKNEIAMTSIVIFFILSLLKKQNAKYANSCGLEWMDVQTYGALSRVKCHFTVQCSASLLLPSFSYDASLSLSLSLLALMRFVGIFLFLCEFIFGIKQRMIHISCSWIDCCHCSTAKDSFSISFPLKFSS